MTRPDIRPPSGAQRRKSTLFCPSCEFESPADGEWVVREEPSPDEDCPQRVYDCPHCETTVLVRPLLRRLYA